MPELPEVELMTQNLRQWVAPCIISISILRQNGKYLPGDELLLAGEDSHMWPVRQGKFIVFRMLKGVMVCHNAMSGYWDTEDTPWTFDYVEGKRTATESDVRVKIGVWDGHRARTLRFHDSRLFGSLRYYRADGPIGVDGINIPSLARLGPDALLSWRPEHLVESCKHSDKTIKEVLMDQREVAGIGNIYATEGLFRARINPHHRARTLNLHELGLIHEACIEVLQKAIATKIDYPSYLLVYRKKNCAMCNSPVAKNQIDGRSTYFCPSCQKW